MRNWFFVIGCTICLSACFSSRHIAKNENEISISSLRVLGEYDLPGAMQLKNSTIGGLSSIDYDKTNDIYYLISDDPSAYGPARYYTAKIYLTEKGIDSVKILDMVPLLDTIGREYPDIRKDRYHSLDAESMRYNPVQDELVYGSEGQRAKNNDGILQVQNPVIIVANMNGSFKDSFALPPNMRMYLTENGLRHNSVFEGLTFNNTYTSMFVSVEEPIYEDGPRAATGDSTAWIRILKFDTKTRKQIAQYAYKIDAVPYLPDPPSAFKINGVSDILYIGNDKFIVTERAYITGRIPSYVRFYLADISGASDISAVNSLIAQPPSQPVSKKLLLNLETLGRHIDNIEGLSLGPLLPNGHRTLIAVADNNFSDKQRSQFWLFEVIP